MEQRTTTTAGLDGPGLMVARTFLAGLAAQDFTAVHDTLAPQVHLRALLPERLREWTGAEAVAGQLERWFGDTERFEPLEVTIGEVGSRVHLLWRFRLQAGRLGPGSFVVEQLAYADVEAEGGIVRLDLVCTGYLLEAEPSTPRADPTEPDPNNQPRRQP